MSAHTELEFEVFMSQLKDTNQTLGFFCDFEKISQNVRNIEISLNMLNYLIGKSDIEAAVNDIWQRDSSAFSRGKHIPIQRRIITARLICFLLSSLLHLLELCYCRAMLTLHLMNRKRNNPLSCLGMIKILL